MREPGEGEACKGTRFVVSGEISSIYKQDGRVRKVHSLILLPGLEEAKLLSKRLEAIGNIHSDGRPILGLSCRDLLEIMLETCPDGIFVPAHIWTPHFSMFGACSGFDTVEECFGDLAPHIHAVETGLSSDPPMNGGFRLWTVSSLFPIPTPTLLQSWEEKRTCWIQSCPMRGLRERWKRGTDWPAPLSFFLRRESTILTATGNAISA